MDYIILYRNLRNKAVGYVSDGDSGKIMVYDSEDAAKRDVPNILILRAFPYQIVPLDEI